MDFDEMKQIWQSPSNALSPAETEEIKNRFIRNLQRSHRRFVGFLVWTFSALTVITGLVTYNFLSTPGVSLHKDWAVIPLLLIPWIFAIGFLLQFQKHSRAHSRPGESIASALRATLDANRIARSRIKRVGLIYLVSIPFMTFVIHQLHAARKIQGDEITSMVFAFAVALLLAGGWAIFRYVRKLLPEKTKIETLLQEYGSK